MRSTYRTRAECERLESRFSACAPTLPQGDVETICSVWDLRGYSGKNADLELAKFCVVDLYREYYPKRLGHVAIVDAPFIFRPVWAIISPLIGKYKNIVKFMPAKDVVEYFNPGEAPECFKQ